MGPQRLVNHQQSMEPAHRRVSHHHVVIAQLPYDVKARQLNEWKALDYGIQHKTSIKLGLVILRCTGITSLKECHATYRTRFIGLTHLHYRFPFKGGLRDDPSFLDNRQVYRHVERSGKIEARSAP